MDDTEAVAERNVDVFGVNSGEILRVRWKCNGNETELTNCPTTDLKFCGANLLAHNSAGVYCFGKTSLSNRHTFLCIQCYCDLVWVFIHKDKLIQLQEITMKDAGKMKSDW